MRNRINNEMKQIKINVDGMVIFIIINIYCCVFMNKYYFLLIFQNIKQIVEF